ncbi:MAG TPA: gliding motility-associated C-terminal domain-containing protein, partial [Chryseosolibacter sp.]|nr:gliding motility-associated C-terminal domain-containing protein [Chryseosolibacter sp.]
ATLDDAESSSPLATPLKTTEYIVTVTDSIGCQARAHVVVLVEETAFIPNLFTPNRDGNNDELRVYGLTEANRFSLRIFNREGKKVYQATTVSEIANQGWDGTSGGVDQPAGVYFWKLDGESPTGRKLLLNGKNSGSIVLVR